MWDYKNIFMKTNQISYFSFHDERWVKSFMWEIHMYMIHSDTLCLWLSNYFHCLALMLDCLNDKKVNPSHAEFF